MEEEEVAVTHKDQKRMIKWTLPLVSRTPLLSPSSQPRRHATVQVLSQQRCRGSVGTHKARPYGTSLSAENCGPSHFLTFCLVLINILYFSLLNLLMSQSPR